MAPREARRLCLDLSIMVWRLNLPCTSQRPRCDSKEYRDDDESSFSKRFLFEVPASRENGTEYIHQINSISCLSLQYCIESACRSVYIEVDGTVE